MHIKYFDELKNLIALSYIAIEEIDKTIECMTGKEFIKNMNLVWHHINGLLIYTARISRILWGNKNKETQRRGKKIREILNISEESIFRYQNRNIRNDFDHIDKKIDEIAKGIINLGNLDRNIGNINTMIGNKGIGDYMRHYDPESNTIYFGKNNLSIKELIRELIELDSSIDRRKK